MNIPNKAAAVRQVLVKIPGNYLMVLSLLLMVLKLNGHDEISWLAVVAPVMLPYVLVLGFPLLLFGLAAVLMALLGLCYLLVELLSKLQDYGGRVFRRRTRY